MKFKTAKHIENGLLSASQKWLDRSCGEHDHEFFELEYILSGSGRYFLDGVEYPIRAGMLFFMSPANFHRVETQGAEIINVMFSYDLCDSARLFDLFARNTAPATALSVEDRLLTESLLKEVVKGREAEYSVQFLRCLLYKLASIAPRDENLPSHIRKALGYIFEHFDEELSLSKVAAYVGLAPTYFSALFKKETGETFKQYLLGYRFDYAKKLLRFTSEPISHIARRSGFADYANFARQFKKNFGQTPMDFRKSTKLLEIK